MTIHIQTPGFTATAPLMNYVKERIEKLGRFSGEIISAEVLLRQQRSDTRSDKLCELRMVMPGDDLLAGAQCKTFEEAVAKGADLIKGQINRKKTKLMARRNDRILL
jgi:ribosomal subunit interface protein